MKFSELATLFEKLENTSSRNDMTELLAKFFGEVTPQEGAYVSYLIQGRLVPKFVDLEFNLSRKLVLRALNDEFEPETSTTNMFGELGDVGIVAETLASGKTSDLSIEQVYEFLHDIAQHEGKGSQEAKMTSYIELITQLKPIGVRYVTRVIIGNLRLGLSDKTVMDALSWYTVGNKSLRKELDIAYGNRADIGELTKVVLSAKDVSKALTNITLQPLTPVAAKLVERAKDSAEVWKRMPECYVQPKLDGLRGQIHFDGKKTAQIYSRNMESLTEQFPEITRDIRKLGGKSIILDAEIIGWDKKTKEYLPFQETIKRRRKYDIEEHSTSIPIRAMCFDVLYYDGKDMTTTPLEERLRLLETLLTKHKTESLWMLETKQMKSEEELSDYFEENVYEGLEGIITKEVGSLYEPGTRNFTWIKLKANTKSDLVDTIDVAVLGYYTGKGARAKFGVGTLLAGVYDPKKEQYYSLGKVGSGFTEQDLETIKKDLDKLAVSKQPKNVHVNKILYPDVWVEPTIIMEIVADELTRSTNHLAAKGIKTKVTQDDYEKGISVRFPRMKIWNRKDKNEPTTVEELVRMYELRKS